MPNSQDAARLLREAAQAGTLAEQQRLVGEAQQIQTQLRVEAQAARDVDWAGTQIEERFAPGPVFSHVTASSDWLADLDTSAPDSASMSNHLTAEAVLWYGRVSDEVKSDAAEFGQHLAGRAGVVAGPYGEQAESAYRAFVEQVNDLRTRDVRTGSIKEAASGLPQVGTPGNPIAEPNPNANGDYDGALPLEATTSERAPQIQELEANSGSGASHDVVPVNDPGLGQSDPSADLANGDAGTQRDGSNMNQTQRSASRHEAVSGLDQIQQTVDPHDNGLAPTPLNPEVAFPITWEIGGANVNRTIQETQQQLAERDQRKGASKKAMAAARQFYVNLMKEAGFTDDSGWAGDMGAGGYQEVPPGAPGHNLGQPDPVYGYGGEQGDRPGTGVGAAEAADYTTDPGMDYQPGDDTHADTGGRMMSTGARHAQDPEIKRALKFIAVREQWLDAQSR
jgi:hypothetical protein